jgi:N-acetylmuramoyl-L-alanine amidase
MKFGIDMGHNCPPHDIGASGVRQEDVVIKEVGTRLIAKLAAAGHSVINCTPTSAVSVNDSLRKRANKANSNNVDIFVSIHFNAFNTKAMGAEVYGISQTSQAIAKSVLTEIVKLGFKNRGVKNTRFSVLVNTSMPAILIECCFVESQADMALFDAEKMAEDNGAVILGGVSAKLNYLVVGDDAGSKLEKAKKINTIRIIDEAAFLKMIGK